MTPEYPNPNGRAAGSIDPPPLVPAESFADSGQITFVYRDSAGRVAMTVTRNDEERLVYFYDPGGEPLPSDLGLAEDFLNDRWLDRPEPP
jgi:hypothetical protein